MVLLSVFCLCVADRASFGFKELRLRHSVNIRYLRLCAFLLCELAALQAALVVVSVAPFSASLTYQAEGIPCDTFGGCNIYRKISSAQKFTLRSKSS